MSDNRIIVFGNDHTNTLGIVQCLGLSGFTMIAVVWGTNSGLVKSSKYSSRVLSARSPLSCIDLILENCINTTRKIPIIACSDTAALILEQNKDKLQDFFLFENAKNYSLQELFAKDLQVKLAKEAGFIVPKSQLINNLSDFKNEIGYPCIIKPLISCQGAKCDIRVCRTENELNDSINCLQHTKRIILQQYIERDYEISILGCGLKNGRVVIPCVENKMSLFPKNVGLECLANIQPLVDLDIIQSINNLIRLIGYTGLFSVEMMHNRNDNRFYFTEINLRNDGANSFVFKYGVNLPLNHIEDLLDLPISVFKEFRPGYYIWEIHHTLSLVHRELAFSQWLKDLRVSKGFLTLFRTDRKPILRQYTNWILSTLHLRKERFYE